MDRPPPHAGRAPDPVGDVWLVISDRSEPDSDDSDVDAADVAQPQPQPSAAAPRTRRSSSNDRHRQLFEVVRDYHGAEVAHDAASTTDQPPELLVQQADGSWRDHHGAEFAANAASAAAGYAAGAVAAAAPIEIQSARAADAADAAPQERQLQVRPRVRVSYRARPGATRARQHAVRAHSAARAAARRNAAEAAEREAARLETERQQQLIEELRRENEQSTSTGFSRACRVCYTEAPQRRAVFTACGHALCRACAEQLKAAADAEAAAPDPWDREEAKPLSCPFCRKEGGFVPLYEEEVEKPDVVCLGEAKKTTKTLKKKMKKKTTDGGGGDTQSSSRSEQLPDYQEEERATLAPGTIVCITCGYCNQGSERTCDACDASLSRPARQRIVFDL